MSFAADLQSVGGKKGVEQHLDAEIDTMKALKDFLVARVKLEKKFLEEMKKVAGKAKEAFDKVQPVVPSHTVTACRGFVEHYEGLASRTEERNDAIAQTVIGSLSTLVLNKETLRADYNQQCRSIDSDTDKFKKDVQKKQMEYEKACSALKVSDDKMVKAESKGQGPKLEKAKADRAAKEKVVTTAHNDYVLAIIRNNSTQESGKDFVLPAVLDTVESLAKYFVEDSRSCLLELCDAVDITSKAEQDAMAELKNKAEALNKDTEYTELCDYFRTDPNDSVAYIEFAPSPLSVVQNSHRSELLSGEVSAEALEAELELIQENAKEEIDTFTTMAQDKEDAMARIVDGNGNPMIELNSGLESTEERAEEVKRYRSLRAILEEKVRFESEMKACKAVADAVSGSAAETTSSFELREQLWYHGVLARAAVNGLLVQKGDFLVRESANDSRKIVLSVFIGPQPGKKTKTSHFQITEDNNKYSFEGSAFGSIRELIDHHLRTQDVITEKSQVMIKRGVKRLERPYTHEDVQMGDRLGKGNFGDVFKGVLLTTGDSCAIKTCKDSVPNPERFLEEADTLNQYSHPNIVRIYGVVKRSPIWILLELCEGGELLAYLRNPGVTVNLPLKTRWSKEAASGIAYLHENNCIHRDLAARNCLLTGGDPNTLKISDFGMSRIAESQGQDEDIYTASSTAKQIPIRWTAPEALEQLQYFTSTDVWGYGVMVWEIYSGGKLPYAGYTNAQTRIEVVQRGYRLERPDDMPEDLYALIASCWAADKDQRPQMTELERTLGEFSARYAAEAADQEA